MKTILISLVSGFCLLANVTAFALMDTNPAGYVRNQGQIRNQFGEVNHDVIAAFFSDGYDLLITKQGFSHQLHRQLDHEVAFHRVDVTFFQQNIERKEVSWIDPFPTYLNFIRAGSDGPHSIDHVEIFRTIVIKDVWNGIDVEFTSALDDFGNVVPKINFLLQHASDLTQIGLMCKGQEKLLMHTNGVQFELTTTLGSIIEHIPYSFIVEHDEQIPVDVYYADAGNGMVTFSADEKIMQSKSPLVIDPIPSPSLNWATYFGGSAAEQGMKTAIDNMGGVFLGGITQSSAGIATAGAYQGTFGGAPFYDAFVAKFDILGNRIWSTYFGGTLDEQLLDMLAEPGGNIYFTGSANSAGLATGGTHQTIIGGGSDAIVVKLSAAGNLIWSTYYGGTSNDIARGLAFIGGNIGITGQTASTNGISSPGVHQLSFGGGSSDGFFASFTSSGAMNWGSYWGGTGTDVAYQIKTTAAFDIVLVASSNSGSMATPGAFQTVLGGSNDILVSKFSSAGVQQWATYYGGALSDNGYGVALDISGDIFITGQTNNSAGFATAGAYDVTLNGATDGFILSLNSAGNRNWSTYVGGTLQDVLQFIWTDGVGNVYVGGNTSSSVGLATVGATQSVFGGGTYDGVLGSFDISGTVNWITYFGGSGDDYIRSGAGDAVSHLYVAGFSSSSSGIATAGAFQSSLSSSGVFDAFLSDYTLAASLPVELISFDVQSMPSPNMVKCTWTVSSGMQCHEYILEKSYDMLEWQSIAMVDCLFSVDGTNFTYDDTHAGFGVVYYRITQVNYDGEHTNMTRSILLNASNQISIFPVPASGMIHLMSPQEDMVSVVIYDLSGRIAMKYSSDSSSPVAVMSCDVSELSAGNYCLGILNGHGEMTFRMISVE